MLALARVFNFTWLIFAKTLFCRSLSPAKISNNKVTGDI